MIVFFIAAILPIKMSIVGMVIDPMRLFLLIMIIPFLLRLTSGRAGPIVAADGFMLAFALWIVVTLVARHGMDRFPYGVILAVEAAGGYLAGRMMIRSFAEYRRFISCYLATLLFLLPFAVYELFYSRMPLADIFRGVFQVTGKNIEFRYDLSRVQVVFPHSILYGLFCSLTIASIFYLYRDRIAKLVPRMALAVGMTLMSLSSAPLISAALQLGLVAWGVVTKDRWRLLVLIAAVLYTAAELLSNRGPVIIFIETFTIDPQTGWWRIYIWRYGSASVMAHPILGIGLDLYDKPDWLTTSVDNFWLLMAMRHGLVGFLFLALAFAVHIRAILRATDLDAESQLARKGYMITLVGLIFTLATVHIWEVMNVMAMFFLGAGSFLYTGAAKAAEPSDLPPETTGPTGRRALPLTRFPLAPKAPIPSRRTPAPARMQSETR